MSFVSFYAIGQSSMLFIFARDGFREIFRHSSQFYLRLELTLSKWFGKKNFFKKIFCWKCIKAFNMDFTIIAFDEEKLSLIHILLTCNISAKRSAHKVHQTVDCVLWFDLTRWDCFACCFFTDEISAGIFYVLWFFQGAIDFLMHRTLWIMTHKLLSDGGP